MVATLKKYRRVEPVLYHTIMLTNNRLLSRFSNLVARISRRSSQFFASNVKSLSISRDYSDLDLEDTRTVLQACPNVEWLAFWGFSRSWGKNSALNNLHAVIVSPTLSPRRLSIMTCLFPEDQIHFSHTIFQNVTHLELVVKLEPKDEVKWDTLGTLQNLTHLSILPGVKLRDGISGLAGDIISHSPRSLRMFVIWIADSWYFVEESEYFYDMRAIYEGSVDMRAVLAFLGNLPEEYGKYSISRSLEDLLNDCAGIPKGKDFWRLAEERIEDRRRRRSH